MTSQWWAEWAHDAKSGEPRVHDGVTVDAIDGHVAPKERSVS